MANFDESSAGYNWETEGVYQIEKNDPVEGGPDGISNRQGRQLTRRTRDLHTRLVALKTQADGLIDQVMGGNVDAAYNTLLKLQNKLRAVESAIIGDNGDTLIETLQEALGFINDHKSEIESLVNTYVKKTSVADNLTTTNAGYVLSANQGKVLKGLIDTLTGIVNGKETPTGAQQKANSALASAKTYADKVSPFDYIVDSDASLAGLNNNPNATCVLIKKGTWTAPSSGILLHPNTKRIVGQPGNLVQYAGDYWCFKYGTIPSLDGGYSIHGVCVKTTGQGHGFVNLVNLDDCKCEGADTYAPDDPYCFLNCKNLTRCSIFIHSRSRQAWGFMSCENMLQCNVRSSEISTDSMGIYNCRNLIQCSSDSGIYHSYNVFMCRCGSYDDCYFSSSAIAIYKCADTMNGGWNKTV